jgi:methanogenic corrinoid protein MtbC1
MKLTKMNSLSLYSSEFERALLSMDKPKVEAIILKAASDETPLIVAGRLVTEVLQRIGDMWEDGKVALSQVYMSGIICEEIIDKLLPKASSLRIDQPKMAIAVFEDFHLLGKRIIYSTLRASGFELMDLGGGMKADQIERIVKEEEIKILLLSVLMLPSALRIEKLKKNLSSVDVKIVVGGAPFRFDDKLWQEVGADACGKDSADALEIVTGLTG